MWFPCAEINELNFDFQEDVKIVLNILKIRNTKFRDEIPDISNLEFVNIDEISRFKKELTDDMYIDADKKYKNKLYE